MKKTLLILSVAILTLTVNAQEKTQFGATAGVNFSNLTSKGFAGSNSKQGFYIGLLAEIPFGKRFSIQPEILYSTQGSNVKIYSNGGSPSSSEFSLDYLQIPILAKVYLLKRFSIEIGPTFNFLLKDNGTNLSTFYSSKFAKSFEFGGVIGTSYKFKNGLFLDAKYIQGFSKAFNLGLYPVKNTVFQLGIGLLF
ncbi:MAG: porin family protein [Lutibacter sp.]|uniref:porin family protein n=1 Tax=Lutibacter sp. TaxID=1925666 RepID=UPI00299F0152|nr:porin family protein [Lutibacter sp.]MDX1830501.1 porin family protein [Lutibacter sp.]